MEIIKQGSERNSMLEGPRYELVYCNGFYKRYLLYFWAGSVVDANSRGHSPLSPPFSRASFAFQAACGEF